MRAIEAAGEEVRDSKTDHRTDAAGYWQLVQTREGHLGLSFGEAEWKALVDYVNGTDLATALAGAAQAQQDALK